MQICRDIAGYRVAVGELVRLEHRCDPAKCAGAGSCCGEYDVWVGPEERERALALLEHAGAHAPELRRRGRSAIRQIGPGAFALTKTQEGLCAFAFRDGDGRVLCSMHAAALATGAPPQDVKPESCFLWPLAIAPSRPPLLFVQDDAYRFPCNRRRAPDGRLDPGVEQIVSGAFGPRFLAELRDAARGCSTAG